MLNEASNSKFVTKKWNIANDQPNANYDVPNKIIYNAEVLKYNLCDYNDSYILVRVDAIITTSHNNSTPVTFRNCGPCAKCITKIDEIT